MFRRGLLLLALAAQFYLNAEHIARFEIKELEWNGVLKKYGSPKKMEVKFRISSNPVFIDSFSGKVIFMRCVYVPVFSDKADKPAYYMVLYDSSNKEDDLFSKAIYEKNMYDASARVKDQNGVRRWTGSMRFVPDTSIHLPRPAWRSDHFTLTIGTFQAWRDLKTGKHPIVKAKKIKKLYYDGQTGQLTEPKKAGKLGADRLEMVVDPIRFQWGSDVWMEYTVRLFATRPSGKKEEILAHKFDSRNEKLLYRENNIENAFENRDSDNVNYMLLTRVYLIPY